MERTKDCPRKRLDAVYEICKSKTVCDGGDELDADQSKEKEPEEDGPAVRFYILNIEQFEKIRKIRKI